MRIQSHTVWNLAAMAAAAVALVVAAAVLESGALAVIVAMLVLAIGVIVFPLVVIHFDEQQQPVDRRRVGARH